MPLPRNIHIAAAHNRVASTTPIRTPPSQGSTEERRPGGTLLETSLAVVINAVPSYSLVIPSVEASTTAPVRGVSSIDDGTKIQRDSKDGCCDSPYRKLRR